MGGGHSQYFSGCSSRSPTSYGIELDTPWSKLDAKQQKVLLYGVEGQGEGQVPQPVRPQRAVLDAVRRRRSRTSSAATPKPRATAVREQIEGYMREVPCNACGGARLKPLSLAVTIDGRNIAEVCDLSIGEAAKVLEAFELERARSPDRRAGDQGDQRPHGLLARCRPRLPQRCLGTPATLAGGEAQRIRLAIQIGSGLVGVLYVLDEPSIGLHQRDNRRLIETLMRLRDLGNTVLVVEHDEETIRVADQVVDIGPGAGEHGGEVVYAGRSRAC